MDKSAKKYKLDEQGNIINSDVADEVPTTSPFAAAFGGGAPAASGGGFSFGGAPAVNRPPTSYLPAASFLFDYNRYVNSYLFL